MPGEGRSSCARDLLDFTLCTSSSSCSFVFFNNKPVIGSKWSVSWTLWAILATYKTCSGGVWEPQLCSQGKQKRGRPGDPTLPEVGPSCGAESLILGRLMLTPGGQCPSATEHPTGVWGAGEVIYGVGKLSHLVSKCSEWKKSKEGNTLLNNFNVFYYCTKDALVMNILWEKEIQWGLNGHEI